MRRLALLRFRYQNRHSCLMNKDDIWQFLIGIMILAIVFMVARPGAPAAAAIEDVSKALANLVQTATEYSVTNPGQSQPQVT